MPNWMTAAQISARYAVSEDRVEQFGFRGNLPLQRQPGGATLFDESEAARLFPRRGASIFSAPVPQGAHLGVLGAMKMGDLPSQQRATPALDPREQRRRALRLGERRAQPDALRRVG